MELYSQIIRPLLFRLDAETAHEWGMAIIRSGALQGDAPQDSRLAQSLFGVEYPNPLGLAAGFDKNATALEQWSGLGFGFVEVGTATYLPQPGNPRPRLFRLPADQAVINRMGFNNDGAEAIAQRIRQVQTDIPLGINLGKSKAAPLDQAPKDYQDSFRLLHRLGSYFVINVSSPNTPGLRQLQDKNALREIIAALQEVDAKRPLFVKISPDLTLDAIDDVIQVAAEFQLTGLVATNTTVNRMGLSEPTQQDGGLSGAPLRARANEVMAHLHRSSSPGLIKIGVGGIFSGDDLYERIASGAHLCQIYTGWVYGGPQTVPRALRALLARMQAEGMASLDELRGSAVRP